METNIDIRDVNAYLRVDSLNYKISGPFNVGSGNYHGNRRLGSRDEREPKKNKYGKKNIQDFRNYKASTEKARVI